jgi:hypothetical protein
LTDTQTISCAPKYILLVVEVCVHARETEFAANSRSVGKMGVNVKEAHEVAMSFETSVGDMARGLDINKSKRAAHNGPS